MIIDFHTHIFPDQIAPIAVEKLQSSGHIPAFTNGTKNGLLNSMKQAGIDYSVILPVATNPLKLTSMNEFSIKNNGLDGLIHFGAVHPDANDWYDQLGYLKENGIKGIKIHPIYQGVDIDDERYLKILYRAGELDLLVTMHAGDDVGFPGVRRCTPKMTQNALKQVGNVKIILAHMGGWKDWQEVAERLSGSSAMLDTSFSLGKIKPLDDTHSGEFLNLLDQDAFCNLVSAFGSDRVLFGTDSPWTDQDESLKAFMNLPISDADKQNILSLNAKKLLGI